MLLWLQSSPKFPKLFLPMMTHNRLWTQHGKGRQLRRWSQATVVHTLLCRKDKALHRPLNTFFLYLHTWVSLRGTMEVIVNLHVTQLSSAYHSYITWLISLPSAIINVAVLRRRKENRKGKEKKNRYLQRTKYNPCVSKVAQYAWKTEPPTPKRWDVNGCTLNQWCVCGGDPHGNHAGTTQCRLRHPGAEVNEQVGSWASNGVTQGKF